MAIPSWTIELLRRQLSEVARKASEPERLEKLKNHANDLLQELPQTAARGLDAVMRSANVGKQSVERWARKHTTLAPALLNASGVLYSPTGTGVPLDPAVVRIGVELLAGGTVGGSELHEKLQRRIDRCLPGGGYSAAVTHRFDAAIAAIAILADPTNEAPRTMVVHRRHAVILPSGRTLPAVLSAASPLTKVVEVGGSNREDESDFAGLDRFVTVLADGGDHEIKLFEFQKPGKSTTDSSAAHSSLAEPLQVVVLPVATLKPTDAYSDSFAGSMPSAQAMLTDGADLVVLSGDGLMGGPPCGILIGRRELVDAIRMGSRWIDLVASDAVTAMMTVAMEASESSPLMGSILTTSEENLRGRADRMATRFSGNHRITNCRVTSEAAKVTSDGRWRLPSRQIRLRHADKPSEAWASELRGDVPSVLAAVDGDELVLDLRWIAAADDRRLAEVIGGPEENAGETSESVSDASMSPPII